jgi:hypothetical protein
MEACGFTLVALGISQARVQKTKTRLSSNISEWDGFNESDMAGRIYLGRAAHLGCNRPGPKTIEGAAGPRGV